MTHRYATAPRQLSKEVTDGYVADDGKLHAGYLTAGKKYRAKYLKNNRFVISDDNEETLGCLVVGCAHIGGQDWLISEE